MEKKEMKCVFCEGKAELKHETIELSDGKIALREQPYYKCMKCKKEFVSSEQMEETEKRINLFSFIRPIISTGRSLAITIPADLAKFYELRRGEKVRLIPESRRLLKVKIG
ncbi:MAG: AbrB/MazE/SpoVT family DNA-binding domain-containing protein [archaeon]